MLGFFIKHARLQDLVSGASDRFKGSTMTISAPQRYSLEARVRKISECRRKGQSSSDRGVATLTCFGRVTVVL